MVAPAAMPRLPMEARLARAEAALPSGARALPPPGIVLALMARRWWRSGSSTV